MQISIQSVSFETEFVIILTVISHRIAQSTFCVTGLSFLTRHNA